MRAKRTWLAYATEAAAVPDDLQEHRLVVTLTAQLSGIGPGTPAAHIGREIEVLLSRPMLEVLAGLAEDVGAVEYVERADIRYLYDTETDQEADTEVNAQARRLAKTFPLDVENGLQAIVGPVMNGDAG